MSRTVLIVEDDALSMKLTRDVLQAYGFSTRECGDGREAVATAVSTGADLIVMDIGLPGMDGIEATRLLKQNPLTKGIPVIAVTAFAMPDDERRMRDAGCDAFLTKPLRLQDLVAAVQGLIGGAPGGEEAPRGGARRPA